MKKRTLVMMLLTFAIVSGLQAEAKIWRVNNNSNYNGTTLWGDNFGGTITYPVFKQMDDIMSSNLVSAVNGDTIHVEGSTVDYTGGYVTKKLVIIGPGYFLNENPKTSNNILQARIGWVYFNAGSAGSQLIGLYVSSNLGVDINVNNIIIKRCRIDYDIAVAYNVSNIIIVQNFFYNITSSNTSAIDVSNLGFPTDFVFNNNICKRTLLLFYGTTTYDVLECKNNVFDCPAIAGNPSIRMNVASFQNNILKTTAATVNINNLTNLNVTHNISSSSTNQFGTDNNNIVVTNMSTLFVDAVTNTTDGDYQLLAASPGSNNGSDGTDRGAFGGPVTNRYTLSGLAPIPVIYEINTSGVATPTGLDVIIKARIIK